MHRCGEKVLREEGIKVELTGEVAAMKRVILARNEEDDEASEFL